MIFVLVIYIVLNYIKKQNIKKEYYKFILIISFLVFIIIFPLYILCVSKLFVFERIVELDNKMYVAVVDKSDFIDVSFYNCYGFILYGTREKVHGYYGKGDFDPFIEKEKVSSVTYTYYDDREVAVSEKYVSLSRDSRNNVVNTYVVEKKFQDDEYNINDNYLMPEDEENLYEAKFHEVFLRFTKVDSLLGQNNLVRVIRSDDNGKNFYSVSKNGINVSKDAKFKFVNEKIGFVISNGIYYLNNDISSFYVTTDGGQNFVTAKFNYKNSNVDFISIEEFPVINNDYWRIHCSVYEIEDEEYINVDLYFKSYDFGRTWDLEK